MTVRVGVIGAGMIGQEHIRRLTRVISGADVVAVTDIDEVRATEVAKSVGAASGGIAVTDSAASLVGRSDVDAVLVTSWGPSHAGHVLAAISAGKPVFCEKPLATTAADCLRIMDAEIAHGSRLAQVGFMRRYDPGYREMKAILSAGEIGTPLMVHCVHRNVSVPERYHSGMAAQDTAVHEIDVLRWLLDDEIVSAQVLTPRATSKRFEHLRDPQFMLFETASGVRIDLEVFVNCQYGYDIQCEVVAEDGVVRLPDPARAVVRRAGTSRSRLPMDWPERFAEAFDVEFQEWIDAVEAGVDPTGPSAWDGYAAAEITDATVRALEGGEVVDVALTERPAFYAEHSTGSAD